MAKARGFGAVPASERKTVRAEALRLAREIQAARRRRGLTQEELAEKLDIGAETVRSIEIGRRQPSMCMLIRITRALRVEIVLRER